MHYFWILLLYSSILAIHLVASSEPSISMVARYSSRNIVLVCDVQRKDVEESIVYLKCPFMTGRICYTNCRSNCLSQNDCFPMITSCSTENISKDFLRLKWSIDITQINKTGDWECLNQNINSNLISIEKYNKKINATTLKTKVETEKPPTSSNVIKEISTQLKRITEEPLHSPEKNVYHQNRNDFLQFITQPNIVLLLICVFTVSLLLNIIFLIRCALFRSVIDHYLRAQKTPNSCLLRCFCISVSQNLPAVSVKSSQQNKPPAYMGYHREEIYDDMSSGSQADRHLINNFSHYELDHDTLMSKKVWSTDGSYGMLNRQPHICQSKSVGNYVLVTGPLCSNRNYVPLSAPSNPSQASNSQPTDAMERSGSTEFQTSDYTMNSDNVIYSQPIKSRTKSVQPLNQDETRLNYQNNFMRMSLPRPLERNSAEQIQYTTVVTEPIPMKEVDLIEHYNNAPMNDFSEHRSS